MIQIGTTCNSTIPWSIYMVSFGNPTQSSYYLFLLTLVNYYLNNFHLDDLKKKHFIVLGPNFMHTKLQCMDNYGSALMLSVCFTLFGPLRGFTHFFPCQIRLQIYFTSKLNEKFIWSSIHLRSHSQVLSIMYLVTLDEDDMLQVVMESSSWFTMEHKYFDMTMCN